MKRVRVIPTLLLERGRLVKTERFGARTYVGDPINSIKIFNDKQVDELVLLDITASTDGTSPNLDLIGAIASECFMPLAYGGGIKNLEQARKIFSAGIEKIVLNSAQYENPKLIGEIAGMYGNQAVVVSIDARKTLFGSGYKVVTHGGKKTPGVDPITAAKSAVNHGAGEIMICNVDHDGTLKGYDLKLTRAVADAVPVPVIASGGAGSTKDFLRAVTDGHASAAAAGALFVFKGPHKAVLVNYPNPLTLQTDVYDLL